MSQEVTNNKKIAKNAVALYFRMIVMMVIGLFTSRIILNALGVTDFGIYNVVGGFVAMFSLVSSRSRPPLAVHSHSNSGVETWND